MASSDPDKVASGAEPMSLNSVALEVDGPSQELP